MLLTYQLCHHCIMGQWRLLNLGREFYSKIFCYETDSFLGHVIPEG